MVSQEPKKQCDETLVAAVEAAGAAGVHGIRKG